MMRRILNAVTEIALRKLAELGFRIWEHTGSKPARRAYLRFMGINHGRVFSTGLGFYVCCRGNLALGDRCWIDSFCRIWNYQSIEIGDDFLAAGGLTLNTGSHNPINLESSGGPIKIGNRVWCGLNVTILPGVTVGDDVVIAACSLVNKDIASNTIVAGVPAHPISELERSETDRQKVSALLS